MRSYRTTSMFLILFLVFLSGCSKDETDRDVNAELQVSKSMLAYTDLGGMLQVLVSATTAWDASIPAADSWCTFEKSADGLKVTAAVNDQAQERSTVVTVVAGNMEKTVTIKQDAREKQVYKIILPDFKEASVYGVMAGEQKIAEICKEYINAGAGKEYSLITAYFVGSDGKINLSRGFVVDNGGSLAWDPGDGKCSYVPGEGKTSFSEIYLGASGRFSGISRSNCIETVVTPELLVDNRGTETNTYKVVKIGAQYWTTQNLRTLYLTDGTRIHSVFADGMTVDAQKLPFCAARDQADAGSAAAAQEREKYGLCYNWYAYKSGKLEPEGWRLPTKADCDQLLGYLERSYDYGDMLTEITEGGTGTNITGFSAQSIGYYVWGNKQSGVFWAFWTSSETGETTVLPFTQAYYGMMIPFGKTYYWAPIRLIRK